MTYPLEGIRLKLRRADERLAFLDRQRIALLKRKGNRVVGKFDPNGDYIFRVPGRLPPLTWGLAVGEYAYYLRTALDNLLWQLVIARGGTPSTGKDGIRKIGTQFPINEDKTDFERKSHGSTVAAIQTAGVLAEDFTFIQKLQPYHAGPDLAKWHPLAMLGYLNNVDKHRYIHAAFASAAIMPTTGQLAGRIFLQGWAADWSRRMGLASGSIISSDNVAGMGGPALPALDGSIVPTDGTIFGWNANGSSDDPAEVLRVTGIRATRRGAKMHVTPGFLLDVSFSDRERPMTISDLQDIRATVQKVVDRFGPHIR